YQDEHAGTGFPTTCLDCHNATDWNEATFDHAAAAGGFALLGSHDDLECSACHAPPPGFDPLFNPSSDQDCYTCHQPDYQEEHSDDNFPTTCLTCHGTDSWDTDAFDHALTSGGFSLIGAHVSLDCSSCHGPPPELTPLFNPASDQDCLTCHQPDYDAAHAGTGFPTTCLDCHNATDWNEATFDHAAVAEGFALLGTHVDLECSACHAPPPDFTPLFDPTSDQDCYTCHQSDYETQHAADGFPTTCLDCHGIDSWQGATFTHAEAAGGFALLGAHEPLPCSACHAPPPGFDPLFNPTSDQDCYACHQPDYEAQHAADGFPTTCFDCHSLDTWDDAVFDHATSASGFALLGAHVDLECTACHAPPPDFTPLFDPASDQDCYTCHQPDYETQHAGDGFPFTCLDCHTTDDWQDATFDHVTSSGGFDLVGTHEALPCTACHAPPPDFTPLFDPLDQDDCLTCHQPDFDQAHGGQGYPTTCLDCHTPTQWTDVSFDHDADFFPIFSGRHEDEWATCQSCHMQQDDFSVFTCLTCHEHNQAEMDERHEDVGGYVYESTACFTCHPTGED
ncbi:MAG: hypothetical protein GVY18_14595, partial [Bacteroidetes bacterium]|nr:hypothetical protein [Bacteroidota bacterium]